MCAFYITLNAIVASYLRHHTADLQAFDVSWFNNRQSRDIAAGRRGVIGWKMVLKHCFKSRMQLQSILYATFRNLSVTDYILIRADDAYFVGEIYTL